MCVDVGWTASRRGDQMCKLRLTVEMAMMGGAAMIGHLNCIWIMSAVDERERETSPLSSVRLTAARNWRHF